MKFVFSSHMQNKMKSTKDTYSSWRQEISRCNFRSVINEIETLEPQKHWSVKEKVPVAMNCLICMNQKCHEAVTRDVNITDSVEDLYTLARLCCQWVSESWDLLSVDIPTTLFYICRYLLESKQILKAITICEYAFEYLHAKSDVTRMPNKTDVPASLLLMFLREAERLETNRENFVYIDRIWSLIFAPTGMRFKCSNFDVVMKFFTNFILKCCKSDATEVPRCRELLRNLMERMSGFEDCLIYVNELKIYWNVFLIYIDTPSFSDAVVEVNRLLKSLISADLTDLNRIIYCVAAMFWKKFLSVKECTSAKHHMAELFEIFLILADQMSNYLKNVNKEREKWKNEIAIVVWLLSYVLEVGSKMDLDLNNSRIYTHIKKAFELSSSCIENCQHLDHEKKMSSFYSIGVPVANMCQVYKRAKLREKTVELVILGCEAFLQFRVDDMSDSLLQLCIQRLIEYLCNDYCDSGFYLKSMQTAVVWSVIFPNCAKGFMKVYGSLKHKLWSSGMEQQLVEMTCWQMFNTRVKNEWQHENLKNAQAVPLLLLELEQCLINNISSMVLVRSILKTVEEKCINDFEKMQVHVTVGVILTNTNDKKCLEYAKKMLSQIDSYIASSEKRLVEYSKDQEMYEYLLGDLYYVKFRIQLLSLRNESEAETNILNSIEQMSIRERGMERELKDKADRIPSNCTFGSAQLEFTKLLDSAVKHWRGAVQNGYVNVDLSRFKDAAMIYRLYHDTTKEIEVWELLYETAKNFNSSEMVVYAYANLLLTPWSIDEEWKRYVENEALHSVDEGRKLLYQLNYFNRCLVDGFANEDVKRLREISVPEIKKWNLWSSYCYLISRCELKKIIPSDRSPEVLEYLAYSDLMRKIKRGKWSSLGECCELQCFLFDLVLYIVAQEAIAYRIWNARQYLVEPVSLIQKLNLPLRSCQFLNASARLDTMTCKLEDCFVKLSSALNILGAKDCNSHLVTRILKPDSTLSVSSAFASDVRAAYDSHSFDFQTSPVLPSRRDFKVPDYIDHEEGCRCGLCSNVFYSYLLCEIFALFAEYYRLTNNLKDAGDYFKGTYSLQKVMENRLQSQNSRLLLFSELKAFTDFLYANYLAMRGDLKGAEKLAHEILRYCSSKNLYLNPACWQLFWFTSAQQYFETLQVEAPRTVRKTNAKSLQVATLQVRTPMCKAKKNTLFKTESEKNLPLIAITPVPRHSRRVLFDDFPAPSKPKAKPRTVKKNKQLDTPPDIVLQTPSALEKRERKRR